MLAAASVLAACSNEPQKSTSTDSTVVESAMGKFDAYGEVITPDSAMDATTLVAEMGNAPTYDAKIDAAMQAAVDRLREKVKELSNA